MNITDVLPVIVLFAVVEFAKGFAEGFFSSEAESTNPAGLDVNTESSGQCAVVHRRKPQSQSSTKEESSSVLDTVEERKAKCREIIRAASKRRWQQRARGRREISLRRMMMVEKRLAAIKMIIKDVLDVFWALSFVLYYAFGLVGFAITRALSSLVSFQSKGIRLWSWSRDSTDRDVNTESSKQYKEELLLLLLPLCIIFVGCVEEGRAKWR